MIKVLCNGVFDIYHAGHAEHLEAARKMGDELWVSITDDTHVHKGPNRPFFPIEMRIKVIKSIKWVDHVIPVSSLIEALDFVKPSILVKGTDYRNGLHEVHENYCRKRGIRIAYTDTPKISASDFIK